MLSSGEATLQLGGDRCLQRVTVWPHFYNLICSVNNSSVREGHSQWGMELRCKVTLVVAPREQARASGLSYPGNCRCLTLFHVLVCPGPGLASENNLFLCPNLPSSRLHLLLILANPCSLAWSSLAADREGAKLGDTRPR